MDEAVIRDMVDDYIKWDCLLSEAKEEIEKFKGKFQKLAIEAMKDKKVKQVEFWGNKNGKVVVTTTEELKLVSYNFLLQIIGEVLLKDFVKVEEKYKLSEPFKRLLTALFQGNYMEQSVEEVIAQISDDEKIKKTLKKKLKGKWDKDVESLKVIAGMSDRDAEHYAYFFHEVMNYEKIAHLLEAAGHKRNTDAFKVALEAIKHAVVVEEGIKVGLDYGKAV